MGWSNASCSRQPELGPVEVTRAGARMLGTVLYAWGIRQHGLSRVAGQVRQNHVDGLAYLLL